MKLLDRITFDPAVMGGKACFRGSLFEGSAGITYPLISPC